jgi:tetratricopeptide (TPR) repeat protein
MSWPETKQQIRQAIDRIRGSKVLDAGTKALLRQIPVLGDFAVDLWSSLGTGDDEKSAQLVKLLEYAETNREAFDQMTGLVRDNAEALKAQEITVDEILSRANETYKLVVDMTGTLEGMTGTLKELTITVNGLVQIVNGPLVRDAARTSAIIEHDRDEVKRVLAIAHDVPVRELSAESAMRLGALYAADGRYQDAELCFFAAADRDPEMAQAYLGLAAIHQLEANRHIAQDNFGLAVDELETATAYADKAWRYHTVESEAVIQMGYTAKDLAQRYILAGRQAEGDPWLERANLHFKMALGVDQDNASAHNGLGDIALIKGDYDTAIEECARATVLNPNYLFAQYDLAQAYYARADRAKNATDRLGDALHFVEVFQTVLKLDGTPEGGTLPSDARNELVKQAVATRDWLASVTGDQPSPDDD